MTFHYMIEGKENKAFKGISQGQSEADENSDSDEGDQTNADSDLKSDKDSEESDDEDFMKNIVHTYESSYIKNLKVPQTARMFPLVIGELIVSYES